MELPQPPQDHELRNIIDKLAQFVARNGPEFESMTKAKQKNNPKFSFLFGGEFYHYYSYKVNAEQALLRQRSGPPFPTPPPQSMPPHAWKSAPPPAHRDSWSGGGGGNPMRMQPRPLMEIHPFGGPPHMAGMPPTQQLPPPPQPPIPVSADMQKLKEHLEQLNCQKESLQEQIRQSEMNLAAQKDVTESQVKSATENVITKCKWDYLERLSQDTGVSLDDIDAVISPIIDNCTKDSIGCGKAWIFTKAVCHENNQFIAHYLAFRVTDDTAPFSLKLHLIYLMNDVLHHCVRKGADELQQSLESVAVEMYSSAWVSSGTDHERNKLSKLIKLWEEKRIFSPSTLNKMRNALESWSSYKEHVKEDYARAIDEAIRGFADTYDSFEKQHDAFVKHAINSIRGLDVQREKLMNEINDIQSGEGLHLHEPLVGDNCLGDQWKNQDVSYEDFPVHNPDLTDVGPRGASSLNEMRGRSSRWDASEQGQTWPSYPPPDAPQQGTFIGRMPDLSKPPPGFGCPPPTTAPPPQPSGPPPVIVHSVEPQSVVFDETQLLPTLPYYELPAGLMVPLVKMEDSGYRPLNPQKIRLPPMTPPSERLLAALDQFYSPPSHERPRDPDGWEILGLYEWSKDKANAIKMKADDIESGLRGRSMSASPEWCASSSKSSPETMANSNRTTKPNNPFEEEKNSRRKRYTSQSRSRSRSRSRTRSRSRESTPDYGTSNRKRRLSKSPPPSSRRHHRSGSRTPSPASYSKRSSRSSRSPSPSHRSSRSKRSCSPDEEGYLGFGAIPTSAKKLDSSNKGHQLLQKMGWKSGAGLGSAESGIVEPISGGELRDRSEQYRGIGSATSGNDPFEALRKNKAGSFYTRMKDRDRERKQK